MEVNGVFGNVSQRYFLRQIDTIMDLENEIDHTPNARRLPISLAINPLPGLGDTRSRGRAFMPKSRLGDIALSGRANREMSELPRGDFERRKCVPLLRA
jgi:hypothetical protein